MEEEESSSSSTTTTSSSSSSTTSTTSTTSSTSTSSAISTATPIDHYRDGPILPGEIRQLFSLPESIIYYIAMNPANAEVYKKLIRTCKYFYNKNPIFFVHRMYFTPNDIYYDGLSDDESESSEHELDPNFPYDHDWKVSFKRSNNYPKEIIDMKNIPFKLWVRDRIDINPESSDYTNIATSIIPKIYQCDVYGLTLEFQNLTLNEFLFLGSNAKNFVLNWITITENYGKKEVMFEKIIEKLPKIQKLSVLLVNECKCISSATVQELLKLQHFGNIFDLYLAYLPGIFDMKTLFAYIKAQKNVKVSLHFGELSGHFKKQLDEIIDEILLTQSFNYKPPRIVYPGLDGSKKKKIYKIYKSHCKIQF